MNPTTAFNNSFPFASFYLLLAFFLFNHASLQAQDKPPRDLNHIYILQNGKKKKVKSLEKTVKVKRDLPYSIGFYNKALDKGNNEYYIGKLFACISREELDKFKVGLPSGEILAFGGGNSMAVDRDGTYGALIFQQESYHYLSYVEDGEAQVRNVGQKGEWYKFEFDVKGYYFYESKREMALKEIQLDEYFLVLWVDRNLNKFVDPGELNKLTIQLK